MRHGPPRQHRRAIQIAIVLAMNVAVVYAGPSYSLAQEIVGQMPVEQALANQSTSGSNPGSTRLSYTLCIVEVPTKDVQALVKNWDLAGATSRLIAKSDSRRRPDSAVVPASFTNSVETFAFRVSGALSEEHIQELIEVGTVVASPETTGYNGEEVNIRIGREVSYVAGFEPEKDDNGHETAIMQPIVKNIHDGIRLDLLGAVDGDNPNVRLTVDFEHSEVKGMEAFTFPSVQGPLTVQQPRLSVHSVQTTREAPMDSTVGICAGPFSREVVMKKSVPLMGRIPYVGRLLKSETKTDQAFLTILLIRCQELGRSKES